MSRTNWKKTNADYALGGPDAPLSAAAIDASLEDRGSISGTVYGYFSEDILAWIDRQPPPLLTTTYDLWRDVYTHLPQRRIAKQADTLRQERTRAIAARRRRFAKDRDQLMLAMLHAGKPYICAHHLCDTMASLHVDHIIPLSKGGGDELENLQFLCATHNKQKGAKYPEEAGPP